MGSLDDSGKPIDLVIQLGTCLREFEDDEEVYWRKRPESGDWGPGGLWGHSERLAEVLLHDSEQLVVPVRGHSESDTFNDEYAEFFKKITDLTKLMRSKLGVTCVPPILEDSIESLAEEDRPPKDSLLALVWERLCISLADDLVGVRLLRGTNRMLRLIGLIKEGDPDAVTLRYLRRVSRCYILGLDAECAILCRGVIDSALSKALPKPQRDLPLAKRIQAAKELRRVDEIGQKAAHRVNNVAKDGVHVDPDLVKGILTVIKDTLEVVRQLAPSKRAKKAKMP